MNYPLISEYIEAIKSPEDNFEELTNLRPVLDGDGEPIMSSGNFAVIFKMQDESTGNFYALKCFTKEQEGRDEAYHQITNALKDVDSPYLVSLSYLDKELFVDTGQTAETEFPVLLMDWVEGKTFDKYLRENLDDKYALEILAYRFSQLAQWLIPQPFAHGDLKPDNILVRDDGTLVLVDYDGMYVPAMKGQKARELGSPDFRHPIRTENDFGEHIDDFPLVSILLSLKAISLQPEFLEQYGAKDRLLFSEKDYRNLSESQVLEALRPLMQDLELASLYSLFILAISQNDLSMVPFRLFNISRPERPQYEEESFFTEVTEEDLEKAWTDEYGAKYSADRNRLLMVPIGIEEYSIIEGTKIICYGAFRDCMFLTSVHIPDSVTSIGDSAFLGCSSLASIHIPNSVTSIGDSAFRGCLSLTSIYIPESVINIGNEAFECCWSLTSIVVDKNNKYYDSRGDCNAIILKKNNTLIKGCSNTNIPDSVTSIGDLAFECCNALTSIHIPDSVTSIGNWAFWGCKSLTSIHIPDSVTNIEEYAFYHCTSLTSVHIPDSVTTIRKMAFWECTSLTSVHIPDSVTSIRNRAFWGCESLTSIIIPIGTREKFEELLPRYKDILVEQ